MKLVDEERAELARALGMKPREILGAHLTQAGVVVTTHDRALSLVRADGTVLSPYVPEPGGLLADTAPAAGPSSPIPLPTVGEVYTVEHDQALRDWLLDQGYAPAVDEPADPGPVVGETGPETVIAPPGGAVVAAVDEQQPAPDKPAEDAGQAGEAVADTPPGGTVDDVLDWVDGDPVRAKKALAAEQLGEKPRSTLIGKLQAIVDGGTSG